MSPTSARARSRGSAAPAAPARSSESLPSTASSRRTARASRPARTARHRDTRACPPSACGDEPAGSLAPVAAVGSSKTSGCAGLTGVPRGVHDLQDVEDRQAARRRTRRRTATDRRARPSRAAPAPRRCGDRRQRARPRLDRWPPAARGCRRSPARELLRSRRSPSTVGDGLDRRARRAGRELRPPVASVFRRAAASPADEQLDRLIGNVVRERSRGSRGRDTFRSARRRPAAGMPATSFGSGICAHVPTAAAERTSTRSGARLRIDACSHGSTGLRDALAASQLRAAALAEQRVRIVRRAAACSRPATATGALSGTDRRPAAGRSAACAASRGAQLALDDRRYRCRRSSSCFISDRARARRRAAISSKSACESFPIARSNSSSLSERSDQHLLALERGARALRHGIVARRRVGARPAATACGRTPAAAARPRQSSG